MADKLWAGRFEKSTDTTVNDFHASLPFDCRMFEQDIRGSIAHARMLASIGVLTPEDARAIEVGLTAIAEDIRDGRLTFDNGAEDIHMFIESELTRRIGDAGKRLHTGRSRNDQVALDLRLYVRDHAAGIRSGMVELCAVLLDRAEEHLDTVMPGYTHLQRAQPITFAHHLMAYVEMVRRDIGRLDDTLRRMDVLPLGSGALAGTPYPLDRRMVARELGFAEITHNSLDGVADRDYAVELASCLALFMVHLSRFSEEIVLWSSQEFRFVELDDAFSTGSSIMPQKKNPDVAELTRGKSGRAIGGLVTLLTMLKGLPLAYNKDLQEDKEAVFDLLDTVSMCLPAFTGMVRTLRVREDKMRAAAMSGFTNATDLADYLVGRGLPFRDAHEVCGRLVRHCELTGQSLEELSLETLREACDLFENDVYNVIQVDACVRRRSLPGGPAPEAVRESIRQAREALGI
ncbi:MAG: argininosuccinate lyase [Clostridiaceae bacterium]|jgi:argininosuccinate lyase|nr:argininosuccinate lyase [Clostridiaceae bacterium]